MTPAGKRPSSEVKILTEAEIQERLYGRFGTLRSPRPDTPWTGAEILAGEMNRLRSELIGLRQEKEALALALQQAQQGGGIPSRTTGWLSRLLGTLALLSLIAYGMGARLLQASPGGAEPTPYTIQVGVYDVEGLAVRACTFLHGMGYEAFLVQMRRSDGRNRYRVYVGSFVTADEARREWIRLSQDPRFGSFRDAFVRIR